MTEQPETNTEIKVERREHHHYHRDGTISVKPTPKKRRHHRRKIRVIDERVDDVVSSPGNISGNDVKCYYIGGKIGAVTYHNMLNQEGQMTMDKT